MSVWGLFIRKENIAAQAVLQSTDATGRICGAQMWLRSMLYNEPGAICAHALQGLHGSLPAPHKCFGELD